MTNSPQRTFSSGDPGLPKNGLLVGGGGGFTWKYIDFALHADGTIEKLEYMTAGGPIPEDYSTVARKTGDPQIVAEFDDKLVANGFWSLELKPPVANIFDYIVAVNEKKGAHDVLWMKDASDAPKTIAAIRGDILQYAIKVTEG